MQTVLVTGATGFVGSRFVRRWSGEYQLLTPGRNELDITSDLSVERYFAQYHPQVVLHLAAISNTGYCEEHPQESYEVNVEGTRRLARAAASCGARFIFFSSDQIYNGNSELGLLDEDVAVSPENVYGKHKLEAERLAAEACHDSIMLRATWMYDRPVDGFPLHGNFVVNIANAIADGKPISVAVREYRGITWVREVVENLPLTFRLPAGVYNYGAQNRLNTYETACCYFEMLGNCSRRCDDIILADAERYPSHERNISISNDKIFRASGGYIYFSDTLDGLRVFIESGR